MVICAYGTGMSTTTQTLRLLDEHGQRIASPEYDPFVAALTSGELRDLYRDLVVVRRLDAEATALQRQGELALWPPLLGQEAAQIGSARALRDDDFVFSSYREHAVAWVRGVSLQDLVRTWRGAALSGWDPYEHGMATPQVIIGAQSLHATGYAMGIRQDGSDAAAITYFGDGATSEGDVSEALVFAASFRAPVLFFCQNNQWAISEPVGLQSTVPIADRASGFGIPAIRVDGNDVLAVLAATRAALARIRAGEGPMFVEAVTYRMGPHTTADDPTRYRDAAELASWRDRDPLARLATHLRDAGVLDDAEEAAVQEEAAEAAAELRAGCLAIADPEPLSIFDHVYAGPHAELDRQRAEYADYLRGFTS